MNSGFCKAYNTIFDKARTKFIHTRIHEITSVVFIAICVENTFFQFTSEIASKATNIVIKEMIDNVAYDVETDLCDSN